MHKTTQKSRDAILLRLIPNVPFDGWTMPAAAEAAVEAGFEAEMAMAVFPDAENDLVRHFADWADRQMLAALKKQNIKDMRVQDKIRMAVRTRLDVLAPYKETERAALGFWARPVRKFEGLRILWRTCDCIWDWAGDTATDYNRYTKRGLLAGVIASTMLFWMGREDQDLEPVFDFLDRRVDNVMMVGKTLAKFKKQRAHG